MPVQAEAPLPRSVLLIATEAKAQLSVDGREYGTIAAGDLRRLSVMPGTHVVSFQVDGQRHDEEAQTRTGEQTVVRYSPLRVATVTPLRPVATSEAPQPSPSMEPPPATPLVETAHPAPSPLPTLVLRAAQSPPSTQAPLPPATRSPAPRPRPADAALRQGAAAAERGDFFRAVMVLKDVTRRLETDPQGVRDLARAYAYLAWSYQGLERPQDARAAADRAVSLDPQVASGLGGFPRQALSLFKRPR
ncbi:MAG: hypothetical protein ABI565_09555 [Vicinamibacteria bacterium]